MMERTDGVLLWICFSLSHDRWSEVSHRFLKTLLVDRKFNGNMRQTTVDILVRGRLDRRVILRVLVVLGHGAKAD